MTWMRKFPTKEQRAIADRICRRFTEALRKHGFSRLRQTRRWERKGGWFAEAIWVHKYTFGPDFRIHWEFLVTFPDRDPVYVSCSSDSYRGPDYRYHLSYHRAEVFQDRCVTDMIRFVEDIILPWLAEWATPRRATLAPHAYVRQQDLPLLVELAQTAK